MRSKWSRLKVNLSMVNGNGGFVNVQAALPQHEVDTHGFAAELPDIVGPFSGRLIFIHLRC